MRPTFIIAASVAALLAVAGQARAQANRTFVSGHGADSNPCTVTAPCRTFTQAITQTNAGGEIVVLDSAGYGSLTIGKSITITNPGGVEAGVTVNSETNAIDINIGAGDVVNLRGLTLAGGGVGANGINFSAVGALNVQNCVIRGFLAGVSLLPTGNAEFNISDTIISNNGSGVGVEIQVANNSTGKLTAVLNRVQALGDNIGFLIEGTNPNGLVNVTIANSTASNNSIGIEADGVGLGVDANNAQIMVVNSIVANNATALREDAFITIYLAKNTIAGNGTAFTVISPASLFSFGDNDVKSNGNDGGTISLVATK